MKIPKFSEEEYIMLQDIVRMAEAICFQGKGYTSADENSILVHFDKQDWKFFENYVNVFYLHKKDKLKKLNEKVKVKK